MPVRITEAIYKPFRPNRSECLVFPRLMSNLRERRFGCSTVVTNDTLYCFSGVYEDEESSRVFEWLKLNPNDGGKPVEGTTWTICTITHFSCGRIGSTIVPICDNSNLCLLFGGTRERFGPSCPSAFLTYFGEGYLDRQIVDHDNHVCMDFTSQPKPVYDKSRGVVYAYSQQNDAVYTYVHDKIKNTWSWSKRVWYPHGWRHDEVGTPDLLRNYGSFESLIHNDGM